MLGVFEDAAETLWRSRQLFGGRKVAKHVLPRGGELRGAEKPRDDRVSMIQIICGLLFGDAHAGIPHLPAGDLVGAVAGEMAAAFGALAVAGAGPSSASAAIVATLR